MKILITGASGFIGQNLTQRLSKKHEVRALIHKRKSRNTYHLRGGNIEVVRGDLRDKKSLNNALDGIEIVYHLAALLGRKSLREKDYYDINVLGTKYLLEACKQTKSIKHFIHCSTAYVNWGNSDSIYKKTKSEGERLVNKMVGSTSFPITVVKPGFAYGNKSTGLLPFLKMIDKHRFFFVGSGKHLFEMVHIDDLTRFFELILNNKKAFNQSFIVSEENPESFREIIRIIAKELNVPFPSRKIPKPLFKIASNFFIWCGKITSINVPFSKETYDTLTLDRSFDIFYTRFILGFETKIPPKKGIKEWIKWYKHVK